MSGRAMTQERARRWPETVTQPGTAWALRMFTEILGPTTLADLLVLCDRWRPDLVIHEEGEYAGPVAAARVGVRWVTHAWGSPLRPTVDLGAIGEHVSPMWQSVGLPVPRWGGLYEHGLLNPCPAALQPEPPGAMGAWPIRPTQLADAPDNDSLAEWNADVYIGFGTVPLFAEDEAALTAAVHACVSRGLKTVVTTSDRDQAARLGAAHPDLVKAATFVALTAVLPSCRLVVCHGGAGTVLSALDSGAPLVIVPKGTPSQTRMAAACAATGVAVLSDPEPDNIAAAIAQVLDDKRFQARARGIADQIRDMPPPPDLIPHLTEAASRQ
ncbi:MAG: hypothetical protein NVS3B26_07230 [Mycobacteriales bacterium]